MEKKITVLIVPGYDDSGPTHWQSIWLQQFPNAAKVIQKEWKNPDLGAWVRTLDTAIQFAPHPIVLVGHSLGCMTIIHWAHRKESEKMIPKIKGAFLVALPDPNSASYRALAFKEFDLLPLNKLPFPSILVSSSNDPFATLEKARYFANCLGSKFIDIGKKGHVGNDCDIGEWKEGKELLQELFEPPN